jgi:hypothetical protein
LLRASLAEVGKVAFEDGVLVAVQDRYGGPTWVMKVATTNGVLRSVELEISITPIS